jgi:8-oxo-dGTP pyrophosphatase MutT (NUDIX family)
MTSRLTGRLLDVPDQHVHASIAPRWLSGDHDLNPESLPMGRAAMRAAAVLVPVMLRPHNTTVLFTRRATHLNKHAGQISFPGGGAEAQDLTPADTALREAWEEVGIERESVRIAGALDAYLTITGFAVTPIVGIVTPPDRLVCDPAEVDEAFEVPLDYLMDPANHRVHSGFHNGVERRWHAIPYDDKYIWGATAGIVMDLYKRVAE